MRSGARVAAAVPWARRGRRRIDTKGAVRRTLEAAANSESGRAVPQGRGLEERVVMRGSDER